MEDKNYVGITTCYFCGKENGLILDKRLKDTFPRHVGVIDMIPCDECKALMDQGVMLISIKDDTTKEDMKGPIPNPYRTGRMVIIKDSAIEKIFDKRNAQWAIKHRFMFVTDSAWDALELPQQDIDNRSENVSKEPEDKP